MFGFLKKKSSVPPPGRPAVSASEKDWVEQNMLWLIEVFGLEHLQKNPFLLPTYDYFPYKNLKDENQFRRLFEQLCSIWKVNPEEIHISIFDDVMSKQWSNLAPSGGGRQSMGTYYREYSSQRQGHIVRIARSIFDDPQLLTAVVAHELAHVKLLGEKYVRINDPDMEYFTDMATIYSGFGIFIANTCEHRGNGWMGRIGYLSNAVISYANALICYVTGHDAANYRDYFNTNTRQLFLQNYAWLKHTNNTLLIKSSVEEAKWKYENYETINEGFKNKQYETAINAAFSLLKITPNNPNLYNYIGYAYLAQKKYTDAIRSFTDAISADPYYDYAYNNRGYCKLQLNDLDNAFADLHTAHEMNPDNSFAWRNLGAFYFKTGDYDKALEYFERANKIDPKTELIHFYLACAYRQLNKEDKAIEHITKSRELDERNDSLFVFGQ